MGLKYLAISDTHVGEPNSLLSFPRGLQELWYALRTNFVKEEPLKNPLNVENLILLGDIPDRTLSSTAEIQIHTSALLRTLLSAVDAKRIIYVIGNHDHTLWTNYHAGSQTPGEDDRGITGPKGIGIIDPSRGRHQDPRAEELLSIFFEYPYGSAWNEIVAGFESGSSPQFVLANPLYAEEFLGRTYVFTHGIYIRADVCLPQSKKALLKKTHLDGIFADLDIDPGEDVRDATDLRDYERRVYPFVDTLWPSARNNPLTKADEIWVLRRRLRIGAEEPRKAPDRTARIAWEDFKKHSDRVKALCEDSFPSGLQLREGNLDRLQDFALEHILRYVNDEAADLTKTKGLTFVYGDTHEGGFAKVGLDLNDLKMVPPQPTQSQSKPLDMHIVNTGGWLVETTNRHPACHLFAVDEAGGEYLLDVSYKDIWVGEDRLLNLAEMQVNQRLDRVGDRVGRIIDFVTSIFG